MRTIGRHFACDSYGNAFFLKNGTIWFQENSVTDVGNNELVKLIVISDETFLLNRDCTQTQSFLRTQIGTGVWGWSLPISCLQTFVTTTNLSSTNSWDDRYKIRRNTYIYQLSEDGTWTLMVPRCLVEDMGFLRMKEKVLIESLFKLEKFSLI